MKIFNSKIWKFIKIFNIYLKQILYFLMDKLDINKIKDQ